MIMELGFTFSKAKDIMMNKRNCARPNSGFQKLLEQKSLEIYHEI